MIAALAPFAALALCAAPWVMLASRGFGAMLAGLGALCGIPLLVLFVLLATAPLGLDPLACVLALSAMLGALGLVLVLRERGALRRPSRLTVARWLPATAGALVWLGTLGAAHLLPRADALSWAMNGDGANNIHLARVILADHGFALPASYAVPLPNVLLALAMAPGRSADLAAGDLLRHDLTAFGAFWALAFAATAVLLGLTASSLLQRGALRIGIASAGGSLLVATWFIAGLPIESGYLNVHVALPFALASWLAFLQSRRHGVASTVVILACGLLMLTAWAPLIAITLGLLAAIAARGQWRRVRVRVAVPVAIVAAVGLLWFGVVAAPALGTSSGAFTTPGHGYPSTMLLFALCAAVAIGSAVALRRQADLPVLRGTVYLSLAAAAALTAMLVLAGGSSGALTSYYFSKLSWLFTVVLLAVAVAGLVRLVAERRGGTVSVGIVVAAVLALCTLGPAPTRDNFRIDQPLDRILSARVWNNGDETVDTILANTGRDEPVLFWQSSSPDEAMIDFWLLEFNGGAIGGNDAVRGFSIEAYREFRDRGSYTPPPVGALCAVVTGLDRAVVVVTANAQLDEELDQACPSARVTIRRE